jgi:tRNA pseudouridine13 synthase
LLVSKLEKLVGIEVYATRSSGVGGQIRRFAEDFVVEEQLVNGSRAQVNRSKEFDECEVLRSPTSALRYLLCVLVKRNWDTFLAIKAIANQLGIYERNIQIAGIKDANAVTAQHITIEGVSAEEVQKVKVRDIEIRPIGYFRSKLSSLDA